MVSIAFCFSMMNPIYRQLETTTQKKVKTDVHLYLQFSSSNEPNQHAEIINGNNKKI
jgi:hypothetical protein